MQKTTTKEAEHEPTLFDVADADDDYEGVELVPAGEAVQLATVHSPTESALVRLARMEHALEVIERQAAIVAAVRKAALKLTDPADWVRMKARGATDDEAFCLLRSSGARKIGPQFYGISLTKVGPLNAQGVLTPIEEKDGDETRLTLVGEAFCALTGETIRGLKASRSDSEKFIGRGGLETTTPLVARGDLAESTNTALYTKAVRVGAGMKNVPVTELTDAWAGTNKKVSSIVGGSGYGTATDRGASSVTGDEVKSEQEKLREEILRRAQGDEDTAKAILKDSTIWTGKDGKERWATSVNQLTKDFQIKKAWAALKAHPVFGDKAQGGNGGAS